MTNKSVQHVIRHGLVLGLMVSAAHLLWQYSHGGISSHHLLHRSDLPSISNAWGLAVLPFLGWLASRSATRRAALDEAAALRSLAGFLGAFVVGLALSQSFAAGHGTAANAIFLAALAAGLFVPTYRAEVIFGFVLGMTFVFGSILPTIAALVGSAISAIAFFVVRPLFSRKLPARRVPE